MGMSSGASRWAGSSSAVSRARSVVSERSARACASVAGEDEADDEAVDESTGRSRSWDQWQRAVRVISSVDSLEWMWVMEPAKRGSRRPSAGGSAMGWAMVTGWWMRDRRRALSVTEARRAVRWRESVAERSSRMERAEMERTAREEVREPARKRSGPTGAAKVETEVEVGEVISEGGWSMAEAEVEVAVDMAGCSDGCAGVESIRGTGG
jgi:hypothetical protein